MAEPNVPGTSYQVPQTSGYFGTDQNIQSWLDQNLAGYLEQNPGAIQWKTLLGASSIFIPTGVVFDYVSATPPDGFVLCDGSLYDGTNPLYLNLWSIIGVTYPGSTNQASFAVPDFRGRVAVGLAVTGGHSDVSALGNNDGVAAANRRPKHNHTANSTGSASAGTPAGTVNVANGTGVWNSSAGFAVDTGVGAGSASTANVTATFTGSALGSHSHSGGVVGPAGTNPVDSEAYIVTNKIIKL